MKAKPWQIGTIAAGLLIGLGSTAYMVTAAGGVELPHQYYLVDVETGQIYRVDSTRHRLIVPAASPQSGRVSLVNVHQDESGKWVVSERDRAEAFRLLGEGVLNRAVDPRTGEVREPLPVKSFEA